MTHTREEVLASAEVLFGESHLAEILAALDEYGTKSHELEINRVKLAILQLSQGERAKLMYWVEMAKVDYRDPLAAQQLGPHSPEQGAELKATARSLIERWEEK